MPLENGEIAPWLLFIIIIGSALLLIGLVCLFLFGLRLCVYDHNVWGILFLFLTFNIFGLIVGIVIIFKKNKELIKRLEKLGFDYKKEIKDLKLQQKEGIKRRTF